MAGTLTATGRFCHIADPLAVALGDIPCQRRGYLVTRTLAKGFVLYAPLRIPFRKVGAVPEILTTEPSSWANDIARFKSVLSRLADADRLAPHSVFGTQTGTQWGVLATKHIDHHLRQFGV